MDAYYNGLAETSAPIWSQEELLRIPDSYDAKIWKSACNSAIDWITGQNVQRLQIFAILAS